LKRRGIPQVVAEEYVPPLLKQMWVLVYWWLWASRWEWQLMGESMWEEGWGCWWAWAQGKERP
jgi:hypothetical protein